MRILLVEDDGDVARFIRRGLSEEAYAVDVATSGAEALELSDITTYDAIVLDVMIPAPDGVEVCRAIRAGGSAVPILMLTARGATIDPLLRAGAIEIDTRSHRVTVSERPLVLTTKEYAVLEYLARNAGRIVGREELAEHVWNEQFDPFTNVIEVYINRLRRHIEKVSEKKLIRTIRGAGYMLDGEEEAARQ